jgi:penicillin-binding protein 2A
MKKTFKICAVILCALAVVGITLTITFFIMTNGQNLSPQKLTDYSQTFVITDENGEEITGADLSNHKKSVTLSSLSQNTVNAFLASEDASFYRHHGLNYKRMVKAFLTNLKSRSYQEGASTISQQLIKNTHLTNDKTIKRKLIEIKLTRQLEKRYSKDEILEMYLNTIYFGHNCYGLESASNYYFDTRAENLTLEQSATLVGLLSSPNNYSPFKNAEKSLKRRNLVLYRMKECSFIDEETYCVEKEKPLSCTEQKEKERGDDYLSCVLSELEELNLNFYRMKTGCKVITYLDKNLQNTIENIELSTDGAIVVTDHKSGGVKAFRSSIGSSLRQPGSTIKPLLVYGPAMEENLIFPYTHIQDEPINFNGYTPKNYDNQYHGTVTVKEALAKSYNIPAVKTLNMLGLKKAQSYGEKLAIQVENEDLNLSLALGGMTYGTTLKQLVDGYSTFAENGNFLQSRFIQRIETDDGEIIYQNSERPQKAFSQSTASLMNGMLQETTKTGTAIKLKDLPYSVAAKTGTNGNKEGNLDAYAIAYTSKNTIGVWLGDKQNKRIQKSGGWCCNVVKDVLNTIYSEELPEELDTTSGTTIVTIDKQEYTQNDRVMLCDDNAPITAKLKIQTKVGQEPIEKSVRFTHPTIPKPQINVDNNNITIQLCQIEYYSYMIERQNEEQKTIIYDGPWKKEISDELPAGKYQYIITPYYSKGDKKFEGQSITLPQIIIKDDNSPNQSPQQKLPNLYYRDWFNE